MTQTIVQDKTARRTAKALTIVARQECEPLDNGGWIVRDTQTGSGTPHIVARGHCDCPDHTRRAAYCKHLQAVSIEERELEAYAAEWNARSAQTRATVQTLDACPIGELPGHLLDTDLNFDDDVLTSRGNNITSTPRCPMCGSPLTTQQYKVGGAGFCFFEVCSGDGSHPARRLS